MGADFFISYTGVDRPWAEWIAVELESAGYSTVLQAWDFAPGSDFVHKMHEAAEASQRTVAVMSREYFGSEFGEAEWRAAFTKDPSGELGLLVPVRVRECRPPGLLASRVWVDLTGTKEAEARDRLLAGVDRNRPRPTSAPFPSDPPSVTSPVPFPGTTDGDKPATVSNLPRANAGFVGRATQLAQIHEGLQRDGRVVVWSRDRMAGIGKTQLALEYANRHGDEYEVVWLVASEQADLIGGNLAQAALTAGLVGPDVTTPAAVQKIHAELANGRRWLLIFDNVEDGERLTDWLPSRTGHVIITSRSSDWHEDAAMVEVGLFDQAESVELLRRRVGALDDAGANQLAEALGNLPLAVAQAASVISQTGMAPDDFLGLLNEHASEILDEGRPSTYPVPLATGINVAMDRLGEDEPAAAQLLIMCATLAPEPVPSTIFTQALDRLPEPLGGVNRLGFHRVVKALADHGLAGTSAAGLQMHRLTQAVVRHRIGDAAIADARARTGELLAAAVPEDTDDPAFWPQWAALAPHLIAADPATSGDPALREATCRLVLNLLRRAEINTAQILVRQLRESWSAMLGADHPHTLKAATEYAHALQMSGAVREANEIVADTLTRYRTTLGDDHPDTLRSASDLAVTLSSLGRNTEARTLLEDTLSRRRRVLGNDHADSLNSATGLGQVLRRVGEFSEARVLFGDCLARQRRTLGDDHPDTLTAATGLASTLLALGELDRALALAEDTFARQRRVLGNDHPDTLSSAHDVAACYASAGRLMAARALIDDTLTRQSRIFGAAHPSTKLMRESQRAIAAVMGGGKSSKQGKQRPKKPKRSK